MSPQSHNVMDPDAKKWVVLIIDDRLDNLEVTGAILRYHGAEVHTAVSAHDGLSLLKKVTPTLILLDLSMPRMSGWEMLVEIRKLPEMALIPVIALTAHAMDGDRERVAEAGFDGYISKPFDVLKIVETIQKQVCQVTANA